MTNEASSISFQALSGAKDENPFAYLLLIDDYTILLDCGWTDLFDVSQIKNLVDCCTRVDAVLISHPCIENIGALPYLCRHCQLSAPIYATIPVSSLGAFLMYDHYCNKIEEGDFKLFNANDIKTTFDSITKLTYHEETILGDNIVITPYKSGRSIGGAVWRIVKGQNEIIYSNSIYNGNDKHLGGFDQSVISQWHPTLWIVDAREGSEDRISDFKFREDNFFRPIFTKLFDRKTVLFPVDGLSRTLEILIILNDEWEKRNIVFPIYFLSHSSEIIYNTVNQLTEWLNKDITEKFLSNIESSFNLKHVRFINDISQIQNIGRDPCVILATSDSLERGFSRQLFTKYVGDSKNLIFFTTKQPKGTLAEKLISNNTHRDLKLIIKYKEPLTGQELADYKQREAEAINQTIKFSESDEEGDSDNNDEGSVYQLTIKSRFQFKIPKKSPITDYGAHIEAVDYAKGVIHSVFLTEKEAAAVVAPINRSILEEPEEVPSKLINKEIVFPFKATSRFYSFDARNSFTTLLQTLKKALPSHVIIIGSTLESTMKLHDVIKDNIITNVSTPSVGDNVHLTQDQSSMKIGLSRALYTRLDFKKYDDHNEVAYIDATLAKDDISGLISAKPVEVSQSHRAHFIGKIDLAELQNRIEKAGIRIKLKNGIYCGINKVLVRQVNESTLSIEGPMCADFIRIRNIIQDMLPMI